jgi:transposase
MENTNAKKLNPESQYELRKQIVRCRQKGISNNETAELTATSVGHCSRVWQTYLKEGGKGISLGKRGRKLGDKRRLTPQQEKEVQKIIVDNNPNQMKLAFMLWTREAVRQLILRLYEIDMPLRTISRYLKRWGFTVKRPLKRAYEQDPVKINKWMKEEYPEIKERAKKEDAEIYWGDETGVQSDANYVRGFSPKGQVPVLTLVAKKSRINMISAINNYGTVRFMIYDETMTCQKLIEFMECLVKDAKKKVFLVLDNLKVHHGKLVAAWLEENKEKIELFFLPPYAPEHNPDEYLNHDLKRSVHSGIHPRNKSDLESKTQLFMNKLSSLPEHVKSYFRHSKMEYAN